MNNKYINLENFNEATDPKGVRNLLSSLEKEKKEISEAQFFYNVIALSDKMKNIFEGYNIKDSDINSIEIFEFRHGDSLFLKSSIVLNGDTNKEVKATRFKLDNEITSALKVFENPDYKLFSKKSSDSMADNEYFTIKPKVTNIKDNTLKSFLNEDLFKIYNALYLDKNLEQKEADNNTKKMKI